MSFLQGATQELQAHLAAARDALAGADAPALERAMADLPKRLGRLRDAWSVAGTAERSPLRAQVQSLAGQTQALREAVARAGAANARGLSTLLPHWQPAAALYDAGGSGVQAHRASGQVQA